MKQLKLTFVLTMLLSIVGLKESAATKIGGINYNLNSTTLEATVTSLSGTDKYAGAVVIPSSVTSSSKTYSVTRIDDSAFKGCSGLTSVTIPNSVTSISGSAFYGCSGLTSVTIPNSVTSIGPSAFLDCSGLTSVTIPNSVTFIGTAAFYGCSGLTSVNIPESVTFIDNLAFSGCSGLTSVNIPESVTSIGQNAFYGTKWFNDQPDGLVYAGLNAYRYKGTMPENTAISIREGTLSICGKTFSGCSNLTSVTIPNSVTSIGSSAFTGCSGLTSVTIGKSVTSIGEQAFEGCNKITSVTLNSNAIASNTYTSSNNMKSIFGAQVTEYVIGDDVTSIGSYAFNGCSGLTSVVIPSSVTRIGYRAFSGCSGLTSVVIPNSVTKIDSEAFQGCTGLKDVYCYPTEVPETNGSAFNDVTAINVALHVPSSSSNKYRLHEVWGQFKLDSYIYLDETAFTYSVDGLSKMKMTIPATEHKLNITAEEGWKVVALTVNDESKMSELKDHVLTINVSADTEVKVTFGWANEANLYTEDPATGIATIEGEGVKVQAKDGQIWVDGAAGKTVRLYTVGGALMTTVTPKADMTGKFSVAAGTYIVQVGNKAAKVVVK